MRIVKVPFSNATRKNIDSLAMIFLFTGMLILLAGVVRWNWIICLVGAGMTALPGCYFWKILTGQWLIWTKDLVDIKLIDKVNDQGFTLHDNDKVNTYKWREIKGVSLEKEKTLVIRFYNRDHLLRIERKFLRWHGLLKKIPPGKMVDTSISTYLDQLFAGLSTCKICGKIALYEEKCLSCGNPIYGQEQQAEFLSEEAYIKEEQLDLFATDEPSEKVAFFPDDDDDGFEWDPEWRPVVTEREVIRFSKKYYRD